MKKSVILLIAVIYILAIVIVGFIGLRMKVYNPVIYVDKITCVSKNFKEYTLEQLENNPNLKDEVENDHLVGYIEEKFVEGLEVEIRCEISPENATDKGLTYSTNVSDKYELIVNKDGTCKIKFYKNAFATVTVESNDNNKSKSRIKIRVNVVEDNFDIFD